MSEPEAIYIVGCSASNMHADGTCTAPVWLPYPQAILPPLSLADGTLVAFAIVSVWAIGVKARAVFRAARMGQF